MNNGRHPSLAAIAASIAFAVAMTLPAAAQVAIRINDRDVSVSPTPMIQDGRVFVPLRGVFEDLGASVVYSNGQINATGNGRDISLQIGSRQAMVDNAPQTLDVAPFIIGASTYVPLRFVSQALGASVAWDDANRVVRISMAGAPQEIVEQANEADGDWVDAPPPPIPAYEPPPVPQANDIWTPGYWAWGEAGYYWVPGTWTQPPEPGLLWTPGYWAANNNAYMWHQGYWANRVGYYGGIDYGAGYYGHGYAGGMWSGNSFRYNTAVTPVVNHTVIRNVYVDKTVINNVTVNRASYSGGPGGVAARPTAAELTTAHATHRPMTQQQQQHVQVAGQDRRGLVTVNRGKPPVVAAPRAFTPATKPSGFVPVRSADRFAGQKLTPRAPLAAPPAAAPIISRRPAPPVAAAPVIVRTAPPLAAARPPRERPPQVEPAQGHPSFVHHAPVPAAATARPPAAVAPVFRRTAPVARPIPAAHTVRAAPAAAPQIAHPVEPAAPRVAHPAAPVAPQVSHPFGPGRVEVRPTPPASPPAK